MGKNIGWKKEEIERLLKAGKTRKEIQAFTHFDRSYIWDVAEALKLAEARRKK